MKQVSKKLLVWSIAAAFFAGAAGGVLTNEYFIAYVVDLMGGKIQENDPIVKRVIEEKVYIESSQSIDAVKKVATSLVSLKNGDQMTSGFVVTADGVLMTHNSIVTKNNAVYEVTLNGGEKVSADLLATDDALQLAFLKIKAEDNGSPLAHPVVEFADVSKMEAGQTVISLESENRYSTALVREGVLRETGYKLSFKDYAGEPGDKLESFVLMADVSDHDTFGGPLINLSGQVVGMVIDASTDGAVVLSATELRLLLEGYLKDGKLERKEFGFSYDLVPYGSKATENLFGSVQFAAKVNEVKNGGMLAKAGLQAGDLIVEVNGKQLILEEGLYNVLRKYQPGETVSLKLMRDGKEVTVELKF